MSNRFDKYSDSQLIILYNKYSDEDAFAELLFRHNDLIEYLAGKVFVDGYDKEDIKQICLMSFLSAIKSYDPQKGVAFGTFAQSCLKHRLAQLVRDSLTKGRSNEEYSITKRK